MRPGDPTRHVIRSPAIDARSRLITALLPLISGFRHSKNPVALAAATAIQAAICDLERLNDVEVLCRVADDKTGPTLWLKIVEILEKP
jgi:hypothetical protein